MKKTRTIDKKITTCSIISLGCPKNLTDGELMIGKMMAAGFRFCENPSAADVVILNTCGFLNDARNEARDVLNELIAEKNRGKIQKIIVTGCAVQWEREKLVDAFPKVDLWLGVFDEFRIGEVVQQVCGTIPSENSPKNVFFSSEPETVFDHAERFRLTLPHVAYLKIADGCSRHCAYCLIPKIRGPFVSRPKELILEDARRLAAEGVREVIVIAQETNFWGIERYGKPMLAELLAELHEIDGFDWIRLMYMYPMHFTDALIDLFAAGKKLLPYIDLPLQHCNDEILRGMNRRTNKAETEKLLETLRERIPNLVLRTSLITGFPGETDTMFDELLAFVQKWRFERAGVFKYSREPGTIAATLPGQIDDAVKNERYERLYAITESQTRNWALQQTDKQLHVIFDRHEQDEHGRPIPNVLIGRTFADAPTIDPVVYATVQKDKAQNNKMRNNKTRIVPGAIVSCDIVTTSGVNLIASVSQ
ncbi:MAG: 30S ribosomal protein S12 methylthiotransferase RimO [Planctomycetaceae bacterium]|nr:30S ribosomal protein S12 methylthiotransferase RimO [Planctomycetaceae bacterium]